MDDSDLLHFTPVPVRARRDGWTARRQYFFILALARGCRPGRAAELLGMTRQSAYVLRDRSGGGGFAAAWDAALERARVRRMEREPASPGERGRHGEWLPRTHRGRLVGWTHRPANMSLMRVLNRLDKWADGRPSAPHVDFDALLDSICPAPASSKDDSADEIQRVERRFCHLPPLADGRSSGDKGA
jgi:hypothetical protein